MKVGFRTGRSFDVSRYNWDGTDYRPLAWTVWYPADESSVVGVPVERSWFKKEPVAVNAPVARSARALPLVLLSHGTGATAAIPEIDGLNALFAQVGGDDHVAASLADIKLNGITPKGAKAVGRF